MARIVSLIILGVVTCLVTVVFVMVMAPFLLPLFLAVLLVVMFRPLHRWLLQKLPKRPRLAAGLTTLSIVLIVLIPTTYILVRAGAEAVKVVSNLDQDAVKQNVIQRGGAGLNHVREWATHIGIDLPPDREIMQTGIQKVEELIAPVALYTTQLVGSLAFGGSIMLIALYFFFADGADMIATMTRLLPVDSRYQLQLVGEFENMSRAVVLATLLSALAQGLLAGIGYWGSGLETIFLPTVFTAVMSLVPFVGATAVWLPCCLWLYFYDGRPTAAILLAAWCLVVVSLVDNLVKPWVLHGRSNLHPLLALLSILGGASTLGPIGILVGPMVVAFLQSLLNILRIELTRGEASRAPQSG